MKRISFFAGLSIALAGCVPIPQAAPVASEDGGLFCEAKATQGCAGCQAACSGNRRAVCIPGTDGVVLQQGSPTYCYRKAECSCK